MSSYSKYKVTNILMFFFSGTIQEQPKMSSRLSAEAIAREIQRVNRMQGRVKSVMRMEEGQSSSVREEITRGKRPELMDEDIEEMPEEEEMPRGNKKKPKKGQKHIPSPAEFYKALSSMKFSGTRYPHTETMQALGIARDVEFMFNACSLGTLMSTPMDGYKEETCQFLSTLGIQLYENAQEAVDDGKSPDEFGFITFEVRDRGYILLISELNRLFGFPAGEGTHEDFEKDELNDLWQVITGEEKFNSARSKSAQIRNPAIRYFHKSLANTLFARKITGNVNEGELQIMDLALLELLNSGGAERKFIGDRSSVGRTLLLIDQLLWCRDATEITYRAGRKTELTVGGIVTPILVAAGVDLITIPESPLFLDLSNLTKQRIIEGDRVNGHYVYKFMHPEVGQARVLLPNPELTAITMGANIDFSPPIHLLYDPSGSFTRLYQDTEGSEADQEPECYYFDEEPPAKSLKEANRRLSLSQKLSKWQNKTINVMGEKIKDLAESMKNMKGQIKRLKKKVKGSSSSQAPPEAHLRRSSSLTIGQRENVPIDPPRRSEVAPREKKRRSVSQKHRRSDSMTHSIYQTECVTQEAPDSTSLVECHPTSVPSAAGYTLESMEAYTASFFTQN